MPGLSQNAERKEKSCTSGRTGVGVGHQRAWHESTVGRLRRQVPARRKSAKMASGAVSGGCACDFEFACCAQGWLLCPSAPAFGQS